jgi:hypothetical protein
MEISFKDLCIRSEAWQYSTLIVIHSFSGWLSAGGFNSWSTFVVESQYGRM